MRAAFFDRSVPRPWRVATMLAIGSGAIASTAMGGIGALLAFVVGVVATALLAWRFGAVEHGSFPIAVTLIAYGARSVAAMMLHVVLAARTPMGTLFLDDDGYSRIAIALANSWRGDGTAPWLDPSLDHNFIRFAAAVLYVVGPNVPALKLVNTALAVLSTLFVYRTMLALGIRGSRLALVTLLFFPSLVLWSALVLKDPFVILFATGAAWTVAETIRSGRFRWMAATIVALLAFENVRPYLFVIMVVAWPLALAVAPLGRRRWPAFALAIVGSALLLTLTEAITYLDPKIVTAAPYIRRAMAVGARSGFVEPNPVVEAKSGDQFRVTVVGRSPAPDPSCVVVPAGFAVEIVSDHSRSAAPGRVFVRPGDIVEVGALSSVRSTGCVRPIPPIPPGPPAAAPEIPPPPTPPPLAMSTEARNIIATPTPTPRESDESISLSRDLVDNLRHFPTGVAFLVAAPFPWEWSSMNDLATAPEVVAWYAAVALALWGLWIALRERRWAVAYPVLVAGGVGLVLSLIEGNVGTLLRHRAMLIPWTVMLAAMAVATWRRRPSQ